MHGGRLAGYSVPEDQGTVEIASSEPGEGGSESADGAVDEPVRLDEGYYLDNFLAVLSTVEAHDRDLLNDDELSFVDDFRRLSLGAQRLYVRLISRRGPSFRRDRLSYAEIDDLDAAADDLRRLSFLDRAEDAPPEEHLGLLLRAELFNLAGEQLEAPPAKNCRKDVLLTSLIEHLEPDAARQAVSQCIEIWRPRRDAALLVFRLLYFGNLNQDWTEFVLRDLGVVHFETYEVRRELRRFDSRQAIDDSLLLRQLSHDAWNFLAEGEIPSALEIARQVVDDVDRWHGITERRRNGILLHVARHLERQQAYDDALSLYEVASYPPARERRARVLDKQGKLDDVLSLCDEMIAAPVDETEAVFAPRFAHQTRRRQGETLPPWKRPQRPRKTLSVERVDGVSVERLALAALAEDGWSGFFAENWLWKNLFGLAFWDVIFAPVPGAFQHAFQYGPLDQHSADFRPRRRQLIESRLNELRQADDITHLLAVHDRKLNTANRMVTWHPELRARLVEALERISGEQLAHVCDRLSRHPGRYRRGFPDLFVWRDDREGFELFEVKGPGDQIRPEQGAWIDYLNRVGIRSRVLRVSWTK